MLIPISKVVVLLRRFTPSIFNSSSFSLFDSLEEGLLVHDGRDPARNSSSIFLANSLLICAVCSSDLRVVNRGVSWPATQRAIMFSCAGSNGRSTNFPSHSLRGQHVRAE